MKNNKSILNYVEDVYDPKKVNVMEKTEVEKETRLCCRRKSCTVSTPLELMHRSSLNALCKSVSSLSFRSKLSDQGRGKLSPAGITADPRPTAPLTLEHVIQAHPVVVGSCLLSACVGGGCGSPGDQRKERAGGGGGLGGGAEQEVASVRFPRISGLEPRWAMGDVRVMVGTGGEEEFSNSLELGLRQSVPGTALRVYLFYEH